MPWHHARMLRRLSEDLVVPEAQPIDAKQRSTRRRDALVKDQLTEHRVDAESAEEVADDLVRALGIRSFHLVEPMPVRVEVLDHLFDRCADGV